MLILICGKSEEQYNGALLFKRSLKSLHRDYALDFAPLPRFLW